MLVLPREDSFLKLHWFVSLKHLGASGKGGEGGP